MFGHAMAAFHSRGQRRVYNLDYDMHNDSNCGYGVKGDGMSGSNGTGTNGVWHGDEQSQFGWLATDVARLMRTVFDRRVRTLGLTRPQWLALVRLNRRPGASQSELADMMEIEKAPAGRIVDRMEEKGWVERRPDPADRRVNRIYLTDRGERVFAAILPISLDTVTDALSDLSPTERDLLITLLSNVKSTLQSLAESDTAPEINWPSDEPADDLETDNQPNRAL